MSPRRLVNYRFGCYGDQNYSGLSKVEINFSLPEAACGAIPLSRKAGGSDSSCPPQLCHPPTLTPLLVAAQGGSLPHSRSSQWAGPKGTEENRLLFKGRTSSRQNLGCGQEQRQGSVGGRWEVGEHLHPAEGPGSLAIGDGEMHVGRASGYPGGPVCTWRCLEPRWQQKDEHVVVPEFRRGRPRR